MLSEVAWPSGLRRWFKAPVSSGTWVRIPPLPAGLFFFVKVFAELFYDVLTQLLYIRTRGLFSKKNCGTVSAGT